MRVGWQLRHMPIAQSADAILLPSNSASELLVVQARLESGQSAGIYDTEQGLLVTLNRPLSVAVPGAIKLQSLAENLLIPVDAELIPALHPDEATGLARDHGLIFLPHREPLAFAFESPVPLAKFLSVPDARRSNWTPFPQKREWASRIESIVLEQADDPELDILAPGGEGIGDEASPLEAPALRHRLIAWLAIAVIGLLMAFCVFLIARLLSQIGTPEGQGGLLFLLLAAVALGLLFAALVKPGRWLGRRAAAAMPKLSQATSRFLQRTAAAMPRLSPLVVQQQDAALRTLLREFQAGKIDEALRHALPLGGFAARGSAYANSAQLPTHDWGYSLRKLVGGGAGPNSIWAGGVDSHALLEAEYRKAAAQAAARGDYRRAAFILAKLLGDFRAAANALKQGGLFHDAAILFLKTVHDPRAAAAAFEAGGEFDRALKLYIELGDLLQAAELLRRGGDEYQALEYFEKAALEVLTRSNDYLAAGNLMRNKAGRADFAQMYFEAGWATRPGKNDVLCALELARTFAIRPDEVRLMQLLHEGEVSLAATGREKEATDFFNEIARLSATPGLAGIRDELRDRCLLDLAGLLRVRLQNENRPVKLANSIFGTSSTWNAAQVSDADFAWKAEVRKREAFPRPLPRFLNRVRIAAGRVTAVCAAPGTGRLFLGFESGAIACFDPVRNQSIVFEESPHVCPVVALATTMEGNSVVARFEPASDPVLARWGSPTERPALIVSASQPGSSFAALRSYAFDASAGYQMKATQTWDAPGSLMAPLLVHYYGSPLCLLVHGCKYEKLDGQSLVSAGQDYVPRQIGDCQEVMLLPVALQDHAFPIVLMREGSAIWWWSAAKRPGEWKIGQLRWTPGAPDANPQGSQQISWLLQSGHVLALSGTSTDGAVHYSEIDLRSSGHVRTARAVEPKGGCLAVCQVRPGLQAAISPTKLYWIQTTSPTGRGQHNVEENFEDAIACFPSPQTDELLIVFQDGEIARVPVPA